MPPSQEFFSFLKRFIPQTVYTLCTRINYTVTPVTNLNKYLDYDTSGTGYVYINKGAKNGSGKLGTKKNTTNSGKLVKSVYTW